MYRPEGLTQGHPRSALPASIDAAAGIKVVEGKQALGAVAPRQVSRKYTLCAPPDCPGTLLAARDSNATKRPSALTDGFWLSTSGAMRMSVAEGSHP